VGHLCFFGCKKTSQSSDPIQEGSNNTQKRKKGNRTNIIETATCEMKNGQERGTDRQRPNIDHRVGNTSKKKNCGSLAMKRNQEQGKNIAQKLRKK